ncbi:hypothetical protein FIBSPDRAFT_937371 [Athelia psychrophila]|uniref:tRNA-binding domain-containing protein n=1 Tax=Athelia psychrophila TaxID=1759441 RepID=A0A166AIW0_9AGAM|nr:hypothetical protein FIBSPDRAFT_937371 [Fibularhizoctonia sp. CBS 109695]
MVSLEHVSKCCFTIARAGTVTPNPKARIPSYLLHLHLSPALHAEHEKLHKKPTYTSSAQLTAQHTPADLAGAHLLAVINFPRKQIGPRMSDCLVTGVVPPGVVDPEVKRAGTVFVRPWQWETDASQLESEPNVLGVTVEPGARVGLIPPPPGGAGLVETNPRDLTWDEFTKVHVCVGTVLGLGSPAAHVADPALQQVRFIVDFGSTAGKRTAIVWLRAPFLDTAQLVGRQLLAVMNLSADGAAAEWFPDGAAAILTVNGRTVLEPAKSVENGFCLA